MAKTSNLREFQEAILLKLKNAAAQSGAVSTSRLAVTVGEKRLLINLADVVEALPVPPMLNVPLTQAWFLGVANIRGNLYNITDLAQFMGMPPTAKSANNRILLLNSESTTQAAILVSSLIGLRSTEGMQKKSVDSEAGVLYSKLAYEDADSNIWFAFDVNSLLHDVAFIQPNI